MELFLSLYKKQVISIVTILLLFGIVSVLNVAEVTVVSLGVIGTIALAVAGFNLSKHLTTPTAFRTCDIKFIISLVSLAVGSLCVIEIVRMIIK